MFFPDRLKISKIIPIFKSDNASLAQNYRPISILPAFSKIFERAVYNRIFQFLVDNDILFKHQFGFRSGHSMSAQIMFAQIRPRSDSKPRKIVARFLIYKDREAVFKAKKKLHGRNMFVNEDYSDRVIKRRTELMPKLKEARRKN